MSNRLKHLEKLNNAKSKRLSKTQNKQAKTKENNMAKKGLALAFATGMTLFPRLIIGIASVMIGLTILVITWSFSDFGAGLRFGFFTTIAVFILGNLITHWLEGDTIFDDYDDLKEEGKIEADRREMEKMIKRGDIRK